MVTEEGVQLDNVWMGQEALNLDLPYQLNQEFLIDVQLVNPLNGTDEPRLLMPRNKHLPELTRPQLPPQLKIPNLHRRVLHFLRSLHL